MLRGMRKILAITTFLATVAALAASIALAATPTGSLFFTGSTAHGSYHVAITTSCSGKKCTAATSAAAAIKAGNAIHPKKGCPYGGYGLPTAKIKQGKFSAATEFVVAGKLLKFSVSGTFTAANKVKGTVSGISACGGSDTFKITGKHITLPVIGGTGSTVTSQ
jgi:hypothetical protein